MIAAQDPTGTLQTQRFSFGRAFNHCAYGFRPHGWGGHRGLTLTFMLHMVSALGSAPLVSLTLMSKCVRQLRTMMDYDRVGVSGIQTKSKSIAKTNKNITCGVCGTPPQLGSASLAARTGKRPSRSNGAQNDPPIPHSGRAFGWTGCRARTVTEAVFQSADG